MVPAWTVTLTYIGYAALLALGTVCWLAALFEFIIYGRVQSGALDQRWLDFAYLLMRHLYLAVWAAAALGAAAFLLAVLPASDATPAVSSHKAYQLRFGAIALLFVGLVSLTRVRMGTFDADVAAVAVFAWALWLLYSGWRAYAGALAVSSPAGWWLAAGADGLAVVAIVAFVILLEIQGFRMF